MEFARIEMVCVRGRWSRGTVLAGAVSGRVKGAVIDPERFVVLRTIVAGHVGRNLATAASQTLTNGQAESDREVLLSSQTLVRNAKQGLGRVSRLWVDKTSGRLTHVLVRSSWSLGRARVEYVVDFKRIGSIGERALVLATDASMPLVLPEFRRDADIAVDVRQALNSVLADPRARRAVKIHVEDGSVMLSGEVDTVEQAHLAEWAVTNVAGVREVTLDVVAQEELAALVERRIDALGLARQNGHGPVHVLSEHGIVYLEGMVPTAREREQIEAAALGAAGARVVVNNVRVAGEPPDRAQGTGPLTRNR